MIPTKLFLFTFLGLILQTNANQHQNFYDFASSSMTYLLDTDADAFQSLQQDYLSVFQKESSAESLQDLLIDYYTTDLEGLDKNPNLTQEELTQKLEEQKLALFETHKSDLLELKHENLFKALEKLFMDYLISYTNLLIRENKALRAADKNTQLTYHIDINLQVEELLYNYINEELDFQNNEDFLKSQNAEERNKTKIRNKRITAFNTFFEEGEPMDLADKAVTEAVRAQVLSRLGFAQLRVDNAYNYAVKAQALVYKMTNTIEGYSFNINDFSKIRKRLSELAFAFYTCTLDLEKDDEKLVLVYNLKHEKKHAQENDKEDQPSEILFNHLIAAVVKIAHAVNPALTHRHLTKLLSTNLFNSGTMGPFLKMVYEERGEGVWEEWDALEEEDREVSALMMTETFNYAVSTGETFTDSDYDNFVLRFSELATVNQAALNYNVVFALFSFNECPLLEKANLDMNYQLYKYLLEFRFTEAENLINPGIENSWPIEFDKYLDARYEAEREDVDKTVLSYYGYMKFLNVIKMVSIDLDVDVSFLEFSEDVVGELVRNSGSVCEPLNKSIVTIVRLFDQNVERGDFEAAFGALGNLVIHVQDLKKIFKFDVTEVSGNIAQDKIDLPNYNFSAKVYSGKYRNIIGKIEETQDNSNLKNKKGHSKSEDSESWVEPESNNNSNEQNDESDEEQNPKTNSGERPKSQSGKTGVLDFEKELKSSSEEKDNSPKYILSQIGNEILNIPKKQNNEILKSSELSHEMSEENNYPLKDTKKRLTKTLSKDSIQTDSESVEKENFNAKNRNGKSENSEDFSEDENDNKIADLEQKENLVEVVAGGDLTRKERDILKDPKVLEQLRAMEDGERKITFENGDGSLTEIVYVQVVPYRSPCYDEIKA